MEQNILLLKYTVSRYVFDTDLADTIRIRYDTHVHDLRFQNLEFWISTTK